MSQREERKRLLAILKEKAVLEGDFALSSGVKAASYFDLKMVLLDPEGAYLAAKMILKLAAEKGVCAVGGYGLGGRLIVAGVVLISFIMDKPIPGFEILEGEPEHRIESVRKYAVRGHLPQSGGKVMIVDDVLSTGQSVFKAIEAVKERGCEVAQVAVILDRQMGGSERLWQEGYELTALFGIDSSGRIYIKN